MSEDLKAAIERFDGFIKRFKGIEAKADSFGIDRDKMQSLVNVLEVARTVMIGNQHSQESQDD